MPELTGTNSNSAEWVQTTRSLWVDLFLSLHHYHPSKQHVTTDCEVFQHHGRIELIFTLHRFSQGVQLHNQKMNIICDTIMPEPHPVWCHHNWRAKQNLVGNTSIRKAGGRWKSLHPLYIADPFCVGTRSVWFPLQAWTISNTHLYFFHYSFHI